MPATKQQIRQIIADNNLNSVADVYSLLRDSFKDILQELMEAELDASLGYEKNQKGDVPTSNKRNGHSPKTVKSQYGEFQAAVPAPGSIGVGEMAQVIGSAIPVVAAGAGMGMDGGAVAGNSKVFLRYEAAFHGRQDGHMIEEAL